MKEILKLEEMGKQVNKIKRGSKILEQAKDLERFIDYWEKRVEDPPHLKLHDEFLEISTSLAKKLINVLKNELQAILKEIKNNFK